MVTHGWFGKVLRVNLSSRTIQNESVDINALTAYIGGRGLAAWYIAREVPSDCNPLGSQNKLVFAPGPLTGTGIPGACRFSAGSKSPLTGTIFDSNAGGVWGVLLKKCGYDALIIEGASDTPVILNINGSYSELLQAEELWGSDTVTVCDRLKKKFGKETGVACIGPAGEKRVKFASIIIDGYRALGRGGLGAVMGAKFLKAITVNGRHDTPVANPEKLKFMISQANKWIRANPITSQGLPEFGTSVLVSLINELGVLPMHNFQEAYSGDISGISGESIARTILAGRKGCFRCPVQCTRLVKVGSDVLEGPEYESIWALGPECGITDLETIIKANNLCNTLGLDTISTGVTIGCAMELTEKGILSDGLKFGDTSGFLDTIKRTAWREGAGNDLADGSRSLAEKYGAGEVSIQVKGLELPAYDPRGLQGMGLAYATSNRGGCHLKAYMVGPEALGIPKMVNRFSPGGKAGLTIYQQNINAAMDSLVVCRFVNLAVSEEYYARMLSAVTGLEYQPQSLHLIGERIWNLERLYNIKAGHDYTSDTLPPRFLKEPLKNGPSHGRVVELQQMLREYYRFRGWDEKGMLSNDKLSELGLEWAKC